LILWLDLPLALSWYVLGPLVVAALDRLVVSLRMRGSSWRTHLLAVTVLPVELLALVGQLWSIRSTWIILRGKALRW